MLINNTAKSYRAGEFLHEALYAALSTDIWRVRHAYKSK